MFCQNVFHALLNIRKRKWLSRLVWRPPKKSSKYKRYTMIKEQEYGTSVCVTGDVLPEKHLFFWALTKSPKSYFMLIHLREILRARWRSSGNDPWRRQSLLSPERTLTLSFGFVPYCWGFWIMMLLLDPATLLPEGSKPPIFLAKKQKGLTRAFWEKVLHFPSALSRIYILECFNGSEILAPWPKLELMKV